MLQAGLVMAQNGRLELRDSIYGYYRSTTVTYLARKKRSPRNKAKWGLLCRSRSSRSMSIKRPVCKFLLVISSNWHPVSYRFGDIAAKLFKFWTLRFWATLWELRDNVRCSSWAHWKACMNFPLVIIELSSLGVTAEALRAKIGDCAPTRSLSLKISGRRGRPPPIIFAWIVRPMNALQLCRWKFSHKETL